MLNVGDRVMIKNTKLGGAVVDEGIATLRKQKNVTQGLWSVEFDEEPGSLYPRFVQSENKITQ